MTVGQLKSALGKDDTKDVSLYFTLQVPKGEKLIKMNFSMSIQDVKNHFLEDEVIIIGEEKHA